MTLSPFRLLLLALVVVIGLPLTLLIEDVFQLNGNETFFVLVGVAAAGTVIGEWIWERSQRGAARHRRRPR